MWQLFTTTPEVIYIIVIYFFFYKLWTENLRIKLFEIQTLRAWHQMLLQVCIVCLRGSGTEQQVCASNIHPPDLPWLSPLLQRQVGSVV